MPEITLIENLRKIIINEVFVTANNKRIVSKMGKESRWLFDFRTVLLRPSVLACIGEIFLLKFGKKMPLQIGTLEVAGIPLAVGLSYALYTNGHIANTFFIRKSRKKTGLLNMIEGDVTDERIILVDDILNSGSSLIRQIEVLEGLGKKVDTVFTILRFRDESYYQYFHEKDITIISLFSLDDFADSLGVHNLTIPANDPVPRPFVVDWYFKSENPNYFYVVPKSAPVLDEKKVYFGSDVGIFWALNQSDGSVAWKYKVGFHAKGKNIFSAPVVYGQTVVFGAYDGNVYALDTETGKSRWIFMEADWVGSSPALAPKLNLVFIGLEFGLFTKQGGIAALDARSGKKVWEFFTKDYVHSSPAFCEAHEIVVCGSNNNIVYGLSAKTGALVWQYQTEAEVKASFAFDDTRSLVVFGSHDSYIYCLDVRTGKLKFRTKSHEVIYSTPVIAAGIAYVSSLDKNIYAINLDTGEVIWQFTTQGRVFSSPAIIEKNLYVGSNDGRLYELDLETGENTAVFQASERITTKIAYNKKTQKIFLQTFANEIFCLSKGADTATSS